jgi:hypothetical protein
MLERKLKSKQILSGLIPKAHFTKNHPVKMLYWESAVRDKPLSIYGLARNRRSPTRPFGPRPSGVHPEEAKVRKGGRSLQAYSPFVA